MSALKDSKNLNLVFGTSMTLCTTNFTIGTLWFHTASFLALQIVDEVAQSGLKLFPFVAPQLIPLEGIFPSLNFVVGLIPLL